VLRTWLLVFAVAGIGIAAAVNGLRGGDDPAHESREPGGETEIAGADVPAPGALPGSLTFLDGECRLQRLDFAVLTLDGAAAPAGCSLWVSPTGDRAVLAAGSGVERDAWLYRLDTGGVPAPLGSFPGDPSWSPDGARIAWCKSTTTSVLTLDVGTVEELPGCQPRFAPTGDLLSVAEEDGEQELLRNGERLLGGEELRSGFPPASGPVKVLGYDERADGLLAVAVASGLDGDLSPAVPAEGELSSAGPFGVVNVRPEGAYRRFVLQLWRGHRLEQAVSLRGLAYPFVNLAFGELVRFGPQGDELAIGSSGVGVPVMLVDVETLEPRLRPTVQQGFSWSPDGAWFALAGSGGISIAGAVRDLPAYVLPLQASSLAWR
jgi:hypothetical protein